MMAPTPPNTAIMMMNAPTPGAKLDRKLPTSEPTWGNPSKVSSKIPVYVNVAVVMVQFDIELL